MIYHPTLITNLSGRLGTSVYARKGRTFYARNLGNPNPNPPTTEQDTIRAALEDCHDGWVALSEAQRTSWRDYSARTLRPSRIGHLRPIGGYAEYCRCNVLRAQALLQLGTTIILTDDPPADGAVSIPLPFPTALSTDGNHRLEVTYPDAHPLYAAAGAYLLVYASPPQEPTINWYRSPMTLVAALNPAFEPSPALISGGVSPPPATGQHVFIKYRLSSADGRLSEPYYDMIEVQP